MAAVNLISSYNYTLVALSVLIAMFASYAALDLAGRVTAANGWARAAWLLGGAGAMGTGIWSMHYIGMLAFILPVPVAYHWPTVLLSLFAAILASVVALGVVSRPKMGWFGALAGSVLMGAGIASMHYIGMAAMRLRAKCQFNSFLVVLSVVFAVLISLAAMRITFHFRDEKTGIGWKKLAGAVVLGAAIPVMHYTGMAAASFSASSIPADLSHAVSVSTLGTAGIAAVTFIVIGLALLTSGADRRFAAQALEIQEAKLQQSEAYSWEAQRLSHTGSFGWKVSTGEIIWSEETFRIFEFDRTTIPTLELVLQRVHPEDAPLVKQTIERASQDGRDFDHEYRLVMPDRSIKHVHVVAHSLTNKSASEFVGAVTDVSERKRTEALLAGEKRLLEMVAGGDSLAQILDSLCRLVEEQASETFASIQLLDSNGKQLWHGAAPSLPKAYNDAVNGILIGSSAGSCGTAAYLGKQVIVSDIASDPSWSAFREIALAYSLRACWSTPIFSADGKVIGTFAMYYREPCSPSPRDQKIVAQITHLAGVAIQRKISQDALRQSEAYLGEAQRLSHTGSWARTATGELRYWSEECYRVLGFDPHGGLPRFETFFQRIHTDDQAKVREIVETAEREKVEYEADYRIVHPGGEVRDIHTVGHPVLNPSGNLVEFVGTVLDITERKRAEGLRDGESRILEMIARGASLEDTLEKLVRVVEAQFVGLLCSVLLLDEDGQHVRHGAAPSLPRSYVEAINGLSIGPKAGSCGTAMYRREPVIVTDILLDPLWEPYRSVAESYGLRACWSTPILAHSGKTLGSFAMYYREPRGPGRAETRALGMATHLAGIAIERKLTQEQLQRSEAYLAEAQRLTHVGSWACNMSTRELIHSSEEHSRLYGFNPEKGTPLLAEFVQRIHPEDRDGVLEALENASRAGKDFDAYFRIVLPDGTTKYAYGTGHPVFNASGDVAEFVGIVMDVTERRRAKEERDRLRQAQAELAHMNRVTTMGELTASLAHEVNQPIAAAVTDAKTCMRWLTRDEPDLEEARAAAMRIVKDATRAAEIISRVRLLFNKGTPKRELIDVNELIGEMIVLLRSGATRYSIAVRTELAADLPLVMGDRVQLQQVLMNLMTNGIDAMKDTDGTRELAIQSQRGKNEQLVVSVSDTGVGLPPQQADRIFNAFFTTKPQGTGMGLRISRSIVESHGGRLWAADNPPRGTSFYFSLNGSQE